MFNYDRRGGGDSTDAAPYALEREIEDLGALIAEAGGRASVYGHSSGAGLALHAAAHGVPISRLVLHEPPYNPDGDEDRQRATRKEAEHIKSLLEDIGPRGEAVGYFWRSNGMPQEMVDGMRNSPRWEQLEAMAPTTMAHDSEIMGDISRGGTMPADLLGGIDRRTLFMVAREWRGLEGTADGERTGLLLTAPAPGAGAGWP